MLRGNLNNNEEYFDRHRLQHILEGSQIEHIFDNNRKFKSLKSESGCKFHMFDKRSSK